MSTAVVDTPPEPSVYETPDVPELEVDTEPPKYDSEYIIDEGLDTQAARNVFERTNNRRPTYPFHTWDHFRHEESRDERLARLQREIEELRDEEPSETLLGMMSEIKSLADESQRPMPKLSPGKVASQISLESIEKMSLLESRLAVLEKKIGSSTDVNLASQIASIRTRLALITASSSSIEQTATKVRELVASAEKLEGSEIGLQIEELFASLQMINEISPTLDLVIERLRTLHKVHEDAAGAKSDIDYIRLSLSSRADEIEAWKSTLKVLEEQVKIGGQVMHGNSAVIERVATELSSKLTGGN